MPDFRFPGMPFPIIPSGGGGSNLPPLDRRPGESVGEALRRAGQEIAARNAPAPTPPADSSPGQPEPYYPPAEPEPYYPPPSGPAEPWSPPAPDDSWGQPIPPGVVQEQPYSDPNGWIGAGLGSWLFGGPYQRRLTKRQRLARQVDNLLQKAVRSTVRVTIDQAGTVISTPRVWGIGARIAAGVGAAILSGIDVLWPSPLGIGTLDPRDRKREQEDAEDLFRKNAQVDPYGFYERKTGGIANHPVQRIGVPDKEFPLGREQNVNVGGAMTPFPTFPEVPKPVQDRGRRGIEKYIRDRAERALKRAVPDDLRPYVPDLGPPSPAAAPSTTTRPAPTATPSSSPRVSSRGGGLPTGIPLYLAIGLISAVVPGLFRRSGGQNPLSAVPGTPVFPDPLSPAPPTPGTDPLTPTIPTSVGFPSIYTSGGSWGGTDYCTPKPRGPRRKCLERAPVKYSGGRRKGKAAGTKCLRWEARKR